MTAFFRLYPPRPPDPRTRSGNFQFIVVIPQLPQRKSLDPGTYMQAQRTGCPDSNQFKNSTVTAERVYLTGLFRWRIRYWTWL